MSDTVLTHNKMDKGDKSYSSNRTSCFDFSEIDEKFGLDNEQDHRKENKHLNCNLLKEITNSKKSIVDEFVVFRNSQSYLPS